MAALNYSRMPGQGDLPGDDSNPNSPYYVEPAFDRDDAVMNVAAQLVEADEVAELVMQVANARRFLTLAGFVMVIPEHMRPHWQVLERQAIALDKRINGELAALGVAA
jgi:hypothetical protein